MSRMLHHTLPNTPGTGPLATNGLNQLNTYQHDCLSQATFGPFSNNPATPETTTANIVSDPAMLVPPTASLYSPASSSIGDVLGRATAPYFDTVQGAVRKLLHRDPPAIYTTLPSDEDVVAANARMAADVSAQEFVVTPKPELFSPVERHHRKIATLSLMASGSLALAGCTGDPNLDAVLQKAIVYNLLGGFGIFMVGLDFLDNGLKSVSGKVLKTILGKATHNRFSSLAVGAGATTIVQSSSVTTVMTIGLVNAGLMSLYGAMGVIAGANIGTTVTGWLFALKVAKYGLPMVGAASIPFLWSKNEKVKNIARAVLGLGLVFVGLKTMSKGFKNPLIKEQIEILFSSLNDPSRWGLVKCMAAGAATTAIVQSSSATVGITIALAKAGVLPAPAAFALVWGENIGTTITAILAAVRPGTKPTARQVAAAHFLFNALGVGAVIAVAPQFIKLTQYTAEHMGITDPGKQTAWAHTFYNIMAASVVIALLPQFQKVAVGFSNMLGKLLPKRRPDETEDEWALRIAKKAGAGASLLQSEEVIGKADARIREILKEIRAFQRGQREASDVEAVVRAAEADLDRAQESVLAHLNRVERLNVSPSDSHVLDGQRREIQQLESVSDHLAKLMITYARGIPEGLPEAGTDLLADLFGGTMQLFMDVSERLRAGERNIYDNIKPAYEQLKDRVQDSRGEFGVTQGLDISASDAAAAQTFFRDMVLLINEILGNIRNIAETSDKKN